jgi:hypothetical protein
MIMDDKPTDHTAEIINKDPLLAVACGHMVENGMPEIIDDRNSGRRASLIIRYDVYRQIGKFVESKTRGEDDMAYIAARSFGWKTQTFDYYFNTYFVSGFFTSYRPFPSFSAKQLKTEQKKKFRKMLGITSCAVNGIIQLSEFEFQELLFLI